MNARRDGSEAESERAAGADRSRSRRPTPPRDQAPAGLLRRLASLTYELLLITAVEFVAGFALLPWVSPPEAGQTRALYLLAAPQRVAALGWFVGIAALYFVWSWTDGRRTLPMKTWRLRLTARDGGTVGVGRGLLRFACALIGPAAAVLATAAGAGRWSWLLLALNFAWALVDPERAFLHDRLAGTRLVNAGVSPARPERSDAPAEDRA